MHYAQWDACIAANLDPFKWFHTMEYPNQLKAQAMQWWEKHNLIESHSEEAKAKKRK